jgi:hypothetical protein
MDRRSTLHRRQAGEAEVGFFLIVVIVCALVSGGVFLLDWIKDSKDAKIRGEYRQKQLEALERKQRPPRDPGSYLAHCQKPPWGWFAVSTPCSLVRESFVEVELQDYRNSN